MNFLFWNTAKRDLSSEVAAIVDDTGANFIVLAEFPGDCKPLLHELRKRGHSHLLIPKIACERIQILSSYPLNSVHHRRDSERYTIKELRTSGNMPLNVVAVHLPSKLHLDDDDQLMRATHLREVIQEVEAEAGHSNTIVLGDFNMNPFDKGMIAANGLNSLPCARTSQRGSRTVDGRNYPFFYNPSWNLLGDRGKTPGSYFHRSPSVLSHYWNTLDQVIVRPSLADKMDLQSVRILDKAGGVTLLSIDSTPNASDHLPLVFSISPRLELA